ncbi:murein hydrolase activator EnvC family protein [Sphingomonas morindae]|uniref:Peptidoglycan DD-metalloendopeptidase family protein n=1 Tax=Sphingomonas morindae TaxID=1541170 RepID=A0ABY4XA94_9SPHN|nr:peptidoglycan DD-metalloendopeptidase family protein [Sphingomonas morindae]USI73601.1 peptidoglycan DD-metalloendopeptidase family protein [Sphingomonas morindae]
MRRPAALAALLALAAPAPGQTPGYDQNRAALFSARRAAAEAEARAAALQAAARGASDEATRARAEAAALTLRVAAAEQDLAAAQARIRLLGAIRARERRRLAARQGPILHLLAALQTMARRPPGLAIAQPGSVADLVHVRLLLADAMPVVAARTVRVRAELARATRLRAETEQAAAALVSSRHTLGARRQALAALEASATQRALRLADRAADVAQQAIGLGETARDIADRLRVDQAADQVVRRLAALPAPPPRPGPIAAAALPLHQGHDRYRLPFTGRVETGFGEVSPSGARARGLSLAVAPRAEVLAPAEGHVAFAGPFRSYGQVVILTHGGYWTTTLTGLATLAVHAGDHVRAGQPIGRAGATAPRLTVELRRGRRPIDVLAVAQAG